MLIFKDTIKPNKLPVSKMSESLPSSVWLLWELREMQVMFWVLRPLEVQDPSAACPRTSRVGVRSHQGGQSFGVQFSLASVFNRFHGVAVFAVCRRVRVHGWVLLNSRLGETYSGFLPAHQESQLLVTCIFPDGNEPATVWRLLLLADCSRDGASLKGKWVLSSNGGWFITLRTCSMQIIKLII